MSAIPMEYTTVAQAAGELAASGKPEYAEVVETIVKAGDWLNFMPIKVANQGSVHKVVRRKSLGNGGTWRAINQGVRSSNPEAEGALEVTGNLEDRCDLDEALLTLNGNSAAFIKNQNQGVQLAMRNTLNDTIIYGNRAYDLASFTGLAPRYGNTGKVINLNTGYDQVQDYGGTTGDLTSIWLIAPGPRSLYMIHQNNGQQIGLSVRVYNTETFLNDRNGLPFIGHRTWYKWPLGLAVENEHAVMRLANIPVADIEELVNNGASNPQDSKLLRKMIEMKNMVSEDVDKTQLKFIVPRVVFTQMDILMFEKTNAYWTPENIRGNWPARTVGMFSGIPVFMSDNIITTEEQVVPVA